MVSLMNHADLICAKLLEEVPMADLENVTSYLNREARYMFALNK